MRTAWVLAACLFALPARAEAPKTLPLDQALEKARQANRTLRAERARLAQAQTHLDAALSALLPTVYAQGKYARNNMEFTFPTGGTAGGAPVMLTIQPKDQLDGVVGFTAPLIVPAAYPAVKAVRSEVAAAEAAFEVSETAILFAVAQAYYVASMADEIVAARASSVDVAAATFRNAQTRFAAGTVTKVDVDRAQLAQVRAEQAHREAREARDQSYRALATLLQVGEGTFQVTPISAPVDSMPAVEPDTALRLRPEFRALELSVQAAHAQARAYGWKWAPGLSLFGNARAFNYDNFARQQHAWVLGAQVEWVLYDGGSRDAARHAAAAQAEEMEARALAMRETIRDEVLNTRGTVATKQSGHLAAERSVELAEETLELVRTQYEAGNTAQIDLLQAQDGLSQALEGLARAHFELALAELSHRRATGNFPAK